MFDCFGFYCALRFSEFALTVVAPFIEKVVTRCVLDLILTLAQCRGKYKRLKEVRENCLQISFRFISRTREVISFLIISVA